ncbi:Uncharacterized protein Fot_37528 [Forsythia ovata]|uniref:Uncharacterized protein n=1 Tax=Forsythia ovata TaxID=205694 RepID=A0ABD1S005_9LAMI
MVHNMLAVNEANEKYSDELRSLDCDDPIRAKKNKDLIFITMISVIHILKQVQQGREPTDVDFCSIAIDGGLENDILQQRLHTVLKQREQLQHMEIELRAQAWAKEDLLREQSKELQSYRYGFMFLAPLKASGVCKMNRQSEVRPSEAGGRERNQELRLHGIVFQMEAVKREATDDDLKVIQMLHAMTMGAEVLPSDAADSWPEGELTYIRAYFERMTRSKDLETCYMMNPDGNSGPELKFAANVNPSYCDRGKRNKNYVLVPLKIVYLIKARVYVELEDSTGSLSGTMIGDTSEKFLQYTGKQLMDSGSEVLEKIRITLEEERFFYIKGMKKNVFENEYKYDIIFLNEPVPSTSTTSTSTRSKTNKGKDIAYTTDTPMPLQWQTFPSAVKQLNFPSSPASKSKKRKIEEHPISSENVANPEKLPTSRTAGYSRVSKDKDTL